MPQIQLKNSLLLSVIFAFMFGMFLHIIILLALIMVHELGHYIMAKYWRWDIDRFVVHLFGGQLQAKHFLRERIKEEITVIIAGPFMHIIIFIIAKLLTLIFMTDSFVLELIIFYNGLLFFFNLLPIYPLDGGRLLQCLGYSVLPFYYCHLFIHLFSLILIGGLALTSIWLQIASLYVLLVIIYLFLMNIQAIRHLPYTHLRFLIWKLQANRPVSKYTMKESSIHASVWKELRSIYRYYYLSFYIAAHGHVYVLEEKDIVHQVLHAMRPYETVGDIVEERRIE